MIVVNRNGLTITSITEPGCSQSCSLNKSTHPGVLINLNIGNRCRFGDTKCNRFVGVCFVDRVFGAGLCDFGLGVV